MGTHAMIGTWNETTGEVTASYVHYDGYIEGVGRTLVSVYNNFLDANLVATAGYFSSLDVDFVKSREESVHNDPPVIFESVNDYIENGTEYAGADYLYLWDGESWFVSRRVYGAPNTPFEEVEMNLRVGVAATETV